MRHCRTTNRRAFTIVEMLVAMALIIFLMAILSEAFVVGLTSFRQLKAIGDMQEQLRQATTVLRRDLAERHFEGNSRLRELTPGGMTHGFFQYGEGVFLNPGFPGFAEGVDLYGSPVGRDADDWLIFSKRLPGNRPEDMFLGMLPAPTGAIPASPLDGIGYAASRHDRMPNTYASQWAVVIYFLRADPEGRTTGTEGAVDATGTPLPRLPLFHLHRRQVLLTPEGFALGTTGTTGSTMMATPNTTDPRHLSSDAWTYPIYIGPSPPPATFRFATPADVQYPSSMKLVGGSYLWDVGLRPSPNISPASPGFDTVPAFVSFPTLAEIDPARAGSDLMLTNVLSFDIKVWDTNAVNAAGASVPQFVDLGRGYYDPTYTGPGAPWRPTAQTSLATTRSLGRPPVRLDFPGIGQPNPVPIPNAAHLSQLLYNNAFVYDTWTRRIGGGRVQYPPPAPPRPTEQKPLGWNFADPLSQHVPYPMGIQAIQIKIRLWDHKTNQAREVTLIQDM